MSAEPEPSSASASTAPQEPVPGKAFGGLGKPTTKSLYRQWWYWVRFSWHSVRSIDERPERVAWGAAIGTWWAFIPVPGQIFFAWITCRWLGGSSLAGIVMTWISNPLTSLPFFWVNYLVGSKLVGPAAVDEAHLSERVAALDHSATLWQSLVNWLDFFKEVAVQMLVGAVINGVILGIAVYFAAVPLVRGYQRLRAARREKWFEHHHRHKAASLAVPPVPPPDVPQG